MKMIREAKHLEKEEPPLAKLMQSTQQAAIQLTIMAKKNEWMKEGWLIWKEENQ